MALINRMSRLFTADVHAVLDRIEEPDVLLKHAIREMDEEFAHSEQRVRQLEHERAALVDRHGKIQAALAELVSQLDVCFANGNDELARKVVKRKLETEKLGQHVAERSASITKELAERRALVDVLAELLGFELALHDLARELVVAVREANVELRQELRQRRLNFAVPIGERVALVLELTHALLGARELFVHFANRVLQQHVGLFDSIEHRVNVRGEQSRHSIDQGHVRRLLGARRLRRVRSLETRGRTLQTEK